MDNQHTKFSNAIKAIFNQPFILSVARKVGSSKDWFPDFIGFVFKEDPSDVDTLERIFKYLTKWVQRSPPDRDSKTIVYQIDVMDFFPLQG